MASGRQQFRWGVVGTGFIARKFALGLHAGADMAVGAVCSRSEAAARAFCEPLGIGRHFTRYADFLSAGEFDAVYIATPGDTHFELARAAIEAGRPVLIEKPFCVNAGEAARLADLARSASVFCMEAMWTRFLPLVQALHARIRAGDIGTPRYFTGSFGTAEAWEPARHLFDPKRGGGAILDRAVYPVSLACMLLGQPERVRSQLTLDDAGGDLQAAATLEFSGGCLAQIFSSMQTNAANVFSIAGTDAAIDVAAPIYRPFEMSIRPVVAAQRGNQPIGRGERLRESAGFHRLYRLLSRVRGRGRRVSAPYLGNGYVHQALEVMRCVRAGLSQSEIMPLDESVGVMQVLDAIRDNAAAAVEAPHVGRVSGGLQ